MLAGHSDHAVFAVTMGMLTGIGGGIARDILVAKSPFVLSKHIYALASILGSSLYYLLVVYTKNLPLASATAMLSVVLTRLLATKYKWSLPRAEREGIINRFLK